MNKLIIVALVAFVATVAALPEAEDTESQAIAMTPTDDEEVADLPESQQQYAQFCKDSRDHVAFRIRTSSNFIASKVFAMLMQSVETLGQDATSTVRDANERLTPQLNNPNAEIKPAEDEVDAILEDAQKKINQGESQPAAFLTGFKATLSAVSKKVGQFVNDKLEQISKNANLSTVSNAVIEVCNSVHEYDRELRSQYKSANSEFGDAINYYELQCVTTRRVARVDGLCSFISAATPALPKLLNRQN